MLELIISILVVAAIMSIGFIAYYIKTKKKESKDLIFGFLLFLQDKYNEVLWNEITKKNNAKNINVDVIRNINDELRKKTEKKFQDLLQRLYCFPDDYSSLYYEPHTHIFIKEICPKLRSAFLNYKNKKRSLSKLTDMFFEETYEQMVSKIN